MLLIILVVVGTEVQRAIGEPGEVSASPTGEVATRPEKRGKAESC